MLTTMIHSRPEAIDGITLFLSNEAQSRYVVLKNAAEEWDIAISGALDQPSFQRVIKIHHEYAGLSLLLFLQL